MPAPDEAERTLEGAANEIAAVLLKVAFPRVSITVDEPSDSILVSSSAMGFAISRRAVDDNHHRQIAEENFKRLLELSP